ncbi:MAG: hypothetical protein E7208_03540 [Clostridium butyricum]|nr:hypothetical protein [Clostridium butyricum]
MQELSNVIAKKYNEVIDKIKVFSDEYLNDEYKDVCLVAAETLFYNNEEAVKKGKSVSWAAGIVHAIGSINNLFDAKEEPYLKATDLYKAFEVSSSTVTGKSKEIKTLLELSNEHNKWLVNLNNSTVKDEVAVTLDEKDTEAFRLPVEKNYIISQKVIDLAWKQKSYTNKYKIAMQAISIYKECADAYIILSRDSRLSNEQKAKYLRRAVKAAENVLKIEKMEDADPRVFSVKAAEPLFGAKYLLATKLWEMGKRDEAINTALEIVKYDKTDKMLVRGLVSSWLLIDEKYDDAKAFLANYEKDIIAATNYNRAATLYKLGSISDAEEALNKAFKRNPIVIEYLTKEKVMPKVMPHMAKLGGDEEAIRYSKLGVQIWNDEEMIKWLKESEKKFEVLEFNNTL